MEALEVDALVIGPKTHISTHISRVDTVIRDLWIKELPSHYGV